MSVMRRTHRTPGETRGIGCFHGHIRYIDPDWQSRLEACGLPHDSDWTTRHPGTQVSESKVTNCFRVGHQDGESIYFKRYVYTRYKKMRYFLRPSKASTEVFGYRQLAKLGIPTLRVLAFSEHRRFGRLVSACVVTQGIDNSRDLEEFARNEWPLIPSAEKPKVLGSIQDKLFKQIHTAHAANFFHQDLHWRNLLLVGEHSSAYEIFWIDCPRARYQKFRRDHAKLVDLSTLSRVAPRYLSAQSRFRALATFFGDRAPFKLTRRWFERIDRHHETA